MPSWPLATGRPDASTPSRPLNMSSYRALTLFGLCVVLAAACGAPGSDVINSAPLPHTSDASSPPIASRAPVPARPSPTARVSLPPEFDAYQNACIQLKALREDARPLAPPLAFSTPTDAARQAQFILFLIDSTRATKLEDFGDSRVVDAQLRLASFASTLRELRKSAKDYAQSGSGEAYTAWEEAWFVADGSAQLLTYRCR